MTPIGIQRTRAKGSKLTLPKERPILFSAPMVRAILDDRKTQTRRVVKRVYDSVSGDAPWAVCQAKKSGYIAWYGRQRKDIEQFTKANYVHGFPCPYGVPGDRLWVKENFRLRLDQDHKPPRDDWWKNGASYEADGAKPTGCGGGPGKLRPSIHMPRWASRITLEVTVVRVERVQNISASDGRAEGHQNPDGGWGPEGRLGSDIGFKDLWDTLNAKRGFSWHKNPWVWCISFRRICAELSAKG